jgi:hypothetical protein
MKLRKNKEKGVEISQKLKIKNSRTKLEKTPNLRNL